MKPNKAYHIISNLDQEEKIGFSYFQQTGKYLDYIDLTYLKQQEDPYDFSCLTGSKARKYHTLRSDMLEYHYSNILQEQLFIAPETNAEIQHLPLYIEITPHRHDFFEIVCTIEGECLHIVEDNRVIMKKGDITIIPPNVKHYLKALPDCITLTIKIRKSTFNSAFSVLLRSGTTLSDYFTQTLYANHYRNSLTFHCGQDQFLPELLLYMLEQQLEKKIHYNYVLEGLLSAFFPYMIQNYEDTIEFASGDYLLNERITAIESYMHHHFQTATLVSTAEHFYLSPSYLSTTIKKQTGYTFSHILQRIKMEHAAQLLLETTMKVEQICENIGYQDTTQFIRTFKKYYGTTPHRFRRGKESKKPSKVNTFEGLRGDYQI